MRRHGLVAMLAIATLSQGCMAGLEDLLGMPPVGGKASPNANGLPTPGPGASAGPAGATTSPAPAVSGAPDAQPQPQPSGAKPLGSPTPTPSSAPTLPPLPAGQRSEADRPDELDGHQIQAIYVIPSDGKDENLDTNGTIERSIQAMNGFFEGQAQAKLRIDSFQGRPDIAFVRLPFNSASARDGSGKVAQDKIIEAVANAGFSAPNKTYAMWYGGPADRGESCDTGGATTGRGGGGYAALYLQACTSNVPGGDPTGKATGADLTIAHEIVHALGYVPDCAPNAVSGGHTNDNENDLMAASGGDPALTELDPGKDDYFGHGREGCLDLARTTFFEPLPARALAPVDRPMVATVPASSEEATLGSAGPSGDEALESALLLKIQAARQAAGLAELPTPVALHHATRRLAESTAKDQTPNLQLATAASGYAGAVGANFLSTSNLSIGADDLLKSFAASPPWLNPDVKELGVAVVKSGGRLALAITSGKGKAQLVGVRLAPGPVNTRTVVVRIQLAEGTPASRVHVKVGDEFYVPSWPVEAKGSVEVLASVPNQGKTSVAVLLQGSTAYLRQAGSLPVLATLEVDGAAAAAGAVQLR